MLRKPAEGATKYFSSKSAKGKKATLLSVSCDRRIGNENSGRQSLFDNLAKLIVRSSYNNRFR